MLFNSVDYLIFYPIVFFIYFSIPKKRRHIWLLIASYYFYMSWNAKYALLMLLSTVVTYLSGRGMENVDNGNAGEATRQKKKKQIVAASFAINLSILFLFKYLNFALETLAQMLSVCGIRLAMPAFDFLLPVGISFYTFQALGYTMDVYHKKIQAEHSFWHYALFVSFFPQLVAGPIERSENLLQQLHNPVEFDVSNARHGLLTMAYGIFLKVVLADNIASVIDPVFAEYQTESGMRLLVAVVLFAFQIYADFNGYTQIAIGSAQVLGYRLMENFKAPYLSVNIRDFWQRWHISLTMWFQDYLYMPLALADMGKISHNRWQHLPPWLCQVLVFLCSGLWHGAAWHYVFWGALNGFYIAIYGATKKLRKYWKKKFPKGYTRWLTNAFSWLMTFGAVVFSMLFFRAESVAAAFVIMQRIVCAFNPSLTSIITLGYKKLIAVFGSLCLMFFIDTQEVKGNKILNEVLRLPALGRWIIYLGTLFLIIYAGAYGDGYEKVQFIYFQF